MRAWWALLICAGCIEPHLTLCGATVCASVQVCSSDLTCLLPQQIAACASAADGTKCMFDATVGFCHHGACVTTLDTCGDGIAQLSLDELCDCGTPDVLAAPAVGCTDFNSNAPGATCRSNCQPAHCGDGIVDINERCDDGNTVSGDGCRADCQGRFEKQETPTGNNLHGVMTLGPTNTYAVGDAGTVVHFDGSTWSTINTGTITATFVAVWINGPDEVYIVGQKPNSTGIMARWDGSAWTFVTPATTPSSGVWASSTSDIYVASSGGTLDHYDGAQWTPLATPCGGGMGHAAVLGTSASNVYYGSPNGLCRFDGMGWTKIHGLAVALLARGTGDEILDVTTPLPQLWRWSGTTLVGGLPLTIPGTVHALTATSATEVLFVGDAGLVLALDGMTWTHLVTPTELALTGVTATDLTNVIAVGDSGTVLH